MKFGTLQKKNFQKFSKITDQNLESWNLGLYKKEFSKIFQNLESWNLGLYKKKNFQNLPKIADQNLESWNLGLYKKKEFSKICQKL